MKKTGILLISLLAFVSLKSQTTNWEIDKAHTSVEFSIDHMVISEVTGKFTDFAGTIASDNEDFTNANIEFSIEVKSINTENSDRDDHLRGADFFDADKYPQITFLSTSFTKKSGNVYSLSGNLTMHGVTKLVTLDAKYGGTVVDPWGNTKAGFKLTGKLDRKDYGLTWNNALETGGLVVGEEVTITARVELLKMK
ncbi:MAG: YceI family protein [Bacteroidales bacterium]|nr:YceI family protein [Bacteroidales bacterium]